MREGGYEIERERDALKLTKGWKIAMIETGSTTDRYRHRLKKNE